jgi:hypothetical protein
MSELEQLISIITYMKKNSDYSLFDNIPESFLKSKSELNKLTAAMYKEMHKKRKASCLYPGCNDVPIKSHSLQKSLLKSIADNTNHVKRIFVDVEFKLNGKFSAVEEDIGINEASTFEGFCSKHDTEIFSPIETNKIDYNNNEHLFLLLYRSITREYYESNKSYFHFRDAVNALIKDMPQENMLGPCLLIQLYLQFCDYYHVEKTKEFVDNCLINAIWDNNYKYFHITLNKFLPIFVNSFFAVQGTNCDILYIKDITKEYPLFCSVTIIPEDNKTDIFYSVAKDQCNELKAFLRQFENKNIEDLELFLSDLVIRNSDNFYISPDYWTKIPANIKMKILEIFKKTITNREYTYTDRINLFAYI